MSCLNVRCKRLGRLRVRCTTVNSVAPRGDYYLRVTPTEAQELKWILPDTVYYSVESNTDWTVE